MDQFMVDISGIPGAMEGDKVTLLGADGQERITAEELGELSGRFNYEFVCTLGKRIPRVYRRNGEITEVKDYFEKFLTDLKCSYNSGRIGNTYVKSLMKE